MGRKILSFLIAFILLFSCASPVMAAENEAPHEHHCDCGTECLCDDCDTTCCCDDCDTEQPIEQEAPDTPEDEEAETSPPEQDLYTEQDSGEVELPHLDHGENMGDETPHTDHDENAEPVQAESGYFLLETRSGVSIVVFGTPDELPGPGISPFLVGSRPCVFLNCTNTVTVNSKYDYVCNSHKCAISGCSSPVYQINPNRCQLRTGITNPICQINVDGNLCGQPSVTSNSICCWYHHCPGCLGIGNGNATVCYYCQQCWVPGCPNYSTCTNECNTHCPHNCKTHHKTHSCMVCHDAKNCCSCNTCAHTCKTHHVNHCTTCHGAGSCCACNTCAHTCKTHHQNHCVTCHAAPCVCFPADPTINVRAWNSADNSVAVDISSARATEIELYTSGGVKFAAISGTGGTHIFRYNAAQNNGGYYVRVKNAAGYNSGSFPFQVSALDIAAPGITGNAVQPANEIWAAAKTLTVTATDQTNALFSLRYEDGSPVPNCPDKEGTAGGSGFGASWTITEHIPDAKTFLIIAADRWGHSSETTVVVSGIDNEKPSKPVLSLDDNGGWHNEDITVIISGSGAASGIKHYEYRVDGGAWQTGSTILVTGEGVHEVEAKAVGGSGLESDIESVTVKIDLTKPTATFALSPEDWTTENVTITLYPADEGGSGLASVTLPNGDKALDLANIHFPVSQNGDYIFTVTDNAGNSTDIVVPVGNIAMLDVTVTLNVPFVISPDDDRLYSGGITFQNYSNVPVSLTLERMTAYGNAPRLVGRDEKAWKSLSVPDTKKYIALGLAGNGVDFWLDAHPHPLGTIAKGGAASYSMQGRFGFAWEQAEQFVYGMAVKVAIAA